MAQYIDKDALVADIERRISLFKKEKKTEKWSAGASQMNVVSLGARIAMLEEILSYLDTLEVKEVDLDYIKKELDEAVRIYKPNGDFGWGTLYNVATHFFELGLKAQKGE